MRVRQCLAVVTVVACAAGGPVAPAPLTPRGGQGPAANGRTDALLEEGERLCTAQAYAPAAAVLEEALALARQAADPRLEARALNLLADVAHGQGELTRGQERHDRALALARETGDAPLEARILRDIGLGHWRRAEYADASARCREALALSTRIADVAAQGEAHACLGRILYKQDRYEEAVAEHARALSLAESCGDLHGQALAFEDLANADRDRDEYTRARDRFRRALALMESSGDAAGAVRVLGLLGHLHLIQGDETEALRYFGQALHAARRAADPAGTASALSKLGGVYARRGQWERALAYYSSAVRQRRDVGDAREEAWALARMGAVHAAQGRLEDALRHYQEAFALWDRAHDTRAPAWALLAVGRIHERRGDDVAALDAYRRALRLGEQIRLPLVSVALGRIGRLHARLGQREEALDHGQRAVAVAQASGNRDLAWTALYDRARIHQARGENAEALRDLRASVALLEALRGGVVPSDEARAGWVEERQEAYAAAVAALLADGRIGEALEAAERARGRAFLDMVAARSAVPAPDLEALREQARRRASTLVEYFSDAERTYIWVVTPAGEVHTASSPAGPDEVARLIAELRRRLRADATNRDAEIAEEQADEEALGLPGARVAAASDPASEAGTDARPVLRALHAALVEPIERWLPLDPNRLVTIVPHGKLFLVSFAALVDADGRYLVERHTLSYAPAIAVLQYTGRRHHPAQGRHLMVVGNPAMPTLPGGRAPLRPLPAAETEARAIGRLFPAERVTLLLGAAAAESRVKRLAPRHGVLHLATHGIVRDDSPMESLLALAPSPARAAGDDGLWRAREVLDLELPADLVTLSACNTGLGRVTGDGVLGLSRAFLHAGAASLVVSLWRVADPVARLQMERFYRELAGARKEKAQALRAAQLATIRALRQGRVRSPSGRPLPEDAAYWAPFVLVGEPR